MFSNLFSKKMSREELEKAQAKREKIKADAEAMLRLSSNFDFKRFCELLIEDREGLNNFLLNENSESIKSNDSRTRLIARINQIDSVLKKPSSIIWQMKNLTEIREAIKEQTHVRQAHGK